MFVSAVRITSRAIAVLAVALLTTVASHKPTKSLVQEITNHRSAAKASGTAHLIPTNADVEHFRHGLGLSRFHFALLLSVCGAGGTLLVLVFLSYMFQCRSVAVAMKDAEIAAKRASALKVHEMERELKEAIALSLKTESFSEAACETTAAVRRDELLSAHAEIEAKEAERLINAKIRAAHFERLAAQASARSGMGHAELVHILRQADEWEFRVLQAAKKLATEVSK